MRPAGSLTRTATTTCGRLSRRTTERGAEPVTAPDPSTTATSSSSTAVILPCRSPRSAHGTTYPCSHERVARHRHGDGVRHLRPGQSRRERHADLLAGGQRLLPAVVLTVPAGQVGLRGGEPAARCTRLRPRA